jgi:zinc protease
MLKALRLTSSLALIATIALVGVSCGGEQPSASQIDTVTIASPDSPLVSVRLMFNAGSIHDPEGKEGLAALTALMVGEAGTQQREYSDLVDALYPMAASIDVTTDREVTVINSDIHREKLGEFTEILKEVMLEPAFTESDFTRNKDQLKTYLTSTLRASNDELLGLEALQQILFEGHPYAHAAEGTVAGLDAISLEDVRNFYAQNFTQANLMLGVAGGYPDGYVDELAEALSALPEGTANAAELPAPAAIEGRNFTLVEKPTASVGIHFGFPLPVNRGDDDYFPLLVANSFLGEHRTFHGRLMQELRGKRGLNYGDYSYIEHYYLPPFTNTPTPNIPRRQQYFSVWVRPVVPNTAHFALRNAIFEVERLIEKGLTQEEFELTRDYLINYSKLWAQTLSDRLGFQMDSRFYGTEYYIDEVEERLAALTVDDVNAAIQKYIQADNFQAVMVTDGAADVQAYIESEEPSPMPYNTPPEPAVAEADKDIEGLPVNAGSFSTVPVDSMFEGGL